MASRMQLKLSALGLLLALSGCCLDVAGQTVETTTGAVTGALVLSCVAHGVVSDGGPLALEDAGNDPRCPANWSDIVSGGDPQICSVNGLVCTFPDGQAECAPDGPRPKWSPIMRQRGCTELSPDADAGCCSPGLECSYITGPPISGAPSLTAYCCDGTSLRWGLQGSFCPNGNTCGTITASDYDQSCSSDSDCVGVPEGDLCDPDLCIDCVGGAINVSAQSQYQADLQSKNSGAPMVCSCPMGPRVACNSGTCGVGGCVDAGGNAGDNAILDCCSHEANDAGLCE